MLKLGLWMFTHHKQEFRCGDSLYLFIFPIHGSKWGIKQTRLMQLWAFLSLWYKLEKWHYSLRQREWQKTVRRLTWGRMQFSLNESVCFFFLPPLRDPPQTLSSSALLLLILLTTLENQPLKTVTNTFISWVSWASYSNTVSHYVWGYKCRVLHWLWRTGGFSKNNG